MNQALHLIPQPKSITQTADSVLLSPTVGGDFPFLHDALIDYVYRLNGTRLYEEADAAIRFVADSTLRGEAYALDAETRQNGKGCVTLRAWTADGARNAMATLLQLLCAENGCLSLPGVHINDMPDSSFRSVMVDLARNFHPFSYLLSYIDLCVLYKIPTLHLHFTDDQSYTLPSHLYPLLSTPDKHYTFAEIDALNRYAASRCIHLMPEIDVPGHCSAFCSQYGEIFGTDGIIVRTAEATDAMQALFSELCDLFPQADRIHIGGDEAAIEKWTQNPACRSYALSCGIDFDAEDKKYVSERLLADFVQKMAEAVLAKGRIPMAWEGFAPCVNQFVTKKLQLMSWENYYQTTPSLLDAGFTIVNSAWRPMYVVTPIVYWSQEEVFQWNVCFWNAVHPGSPYRDTGITVPKNPQIIGGQLLAWGDAIAAHYPILSEGLSVERRLVAERAPMLAENTWNNQKCRDYANIKAAFDACDQIYHRLGE